MGESLHDDAIARSLHIAISYSWAASRAGYPEERLKLLEVPSMSFIVVMPRRLVLTRRMMPEC